jgi:DNA repair photolyase
MSTQAALPLAPLPVLETAAPSRRKPGDPAGPREGGSLELRLRRAARGGGPVVLGSAAEPYAPPAGGWEGRSPLAVLLRSEGLEVVITTRAPEILDDIDLLVELDRRHAVTVDLLLAAVDPFLSRRLEPGAAEPRTRLRALARLAAEGLAVRLVCTPLKAGLNDRESALRPLFAAAREYGAQDVLAASARPSRLARLRGALTGRRTALAEPDHLRRLRLEFGFPRPVAGRG